MRPTKLQARLLRDYAGLPVGLVGDVIDAIQGNSLLVKFPGREAPVLVWYEAVEMIRKP